VRLCGDRAGGLAGAGKAGCKGGRCGTPRDMCSGLRPPRRTCTERASAKVQALWPTSATRNLPSAGLEEWTQHHYVHPSPSPHDMCSGSLAVRGTRQFRARAKRPGGGLRASRDGFGSGLCLATWLTVAGFQGHVLLGARGMDITPLCPSVATPQAHVLTVSGTPSNMSIRRQRPRHMSSRFRALQAACPSLAATETHVRRGRRLRGDMSSRAAADWACPPGRGRHVPPGRGRVTPPAPRGPQAIQVRGLRVRRRAPGASC
jgi:hypothetical protein